MVPLIGSVDQIVDQIFVMVVVGGAAGWLAAALLRVRALSFVGTTVVGVVGSFIGIMLFRLADIRIEGYQIGPLPIGHLVAAFLGAALLMILLRLVRRQRG